jgi:hypothetical protein
MTRGRLLAILVAVAMVSTIWMLLPRRVRELTLAPDPRIVRGAIHIHTTRSDGAGTPDDVARAARRARLDFVILTDHGDGLRVPDPPRYVDGVLVIDAVEISTADGHYVALGIGQAPYRLAGDARDVIDDVHRLGGFGFAAHPDSPKPDLRWREWDVPVDGIEWLNADSEWRDETRWTLARVLLTYWFRGPESVVSMFDRPALTLVRWDQLSGVHRVVGMAGTDAHARLPLQPDTEPGRGPSLHLPSYESSFRAMANRVVLTAPLGRTDPTADARTLLDAIRAGHVFTVIDGVAGPAELEFTAESKGVRAAMGDDIVASGPVTLTATLRPSLPEASLVAIKYGQEIASGPGDAPLRIVHDTSTEGVYRIEVRLDAAPGVPPVPWIVSNPIYVRHVARVAPRTGDATFPGRRLTDGQGHRAWVVERQPASEARVGQGSAPDGLAAAHFSWRLAGGAPSGQYAALSMAVGASDFAGATGLQVLLQAPRPMRVSVQLRVPVRGGLRWERSVYVDTTARNVWIPFAEMRSIEAVAGGRLDLQRVDTLLIVVDTVNALPGSAGECWVGAVTAAAGAGAY